MMCVYNDQSGGGQLIWASIKGQRVARGGVVWFLAAWRTTPGAPEQASFGSGPGLMRWLWHCAKRVHDAGQHGTRHWEHARGCWGEETVVSGEGRGDSSVGMKACLTLRR